MATDRGCPPPLVTKSFFFLLQKFSFYKVFLQKFSQNFLTFCTCPHVESCKALQAPQAERPWTVCSSSSLLKSSQCKIHKDSAEHVQTTDRWMLRKIAI